MSEIIRFLIYFLRKNFREEISGFKNFVFTFFPFENFVEVNFLDFGKFL